MTGMPANPSPRARIPARLLWGLETALGGRRPTPNAHSTGRASPDTLDTDSTHGAGFVASNTNGSSCTLSVAIAAGLARRLALRETASEAKDYLHGALDAGAALHVGQGRGPVHHFHRWWNA